MNSGSIRHWTSGVGGVGRKEGREGWGGGGWVRGRDVKSTLPSFHRRHPIQSRAEGRDSVVRPGHRGPRGVAKAGRGRQHCQGKNHHRQFEKRGEEVGILL